MTVSKVDVLRAEIGMLEEMLREIGDGRIIERMGLKERMRTLQAEIETLQPAGHRFALTFRGEPVEGSRSIAADFAGRALTAFSDAVATIAASFRGELRSTGPLPNHADSQGLRIVGPALGSFGFELEIPPVAEPQHLLWANEDPRALAVERAMRLVDAAKSNDDEALSELIADVHVRARAKVLEFVRCVVDHRATFQVRLGDKESGLRELEDGQRVLRALRQEDVLEREIDRRGQLWVLPVGNSSPNNFAFFTAFYSICTSFIMVYRQHA